MSTSPGQCRNQNKHFKARQDHENTQFVIPKWVCLQHSLLKAFEQVACTTHAVLITCKDTESLVHTYIIFFILCLCENCREVLPGLL